jgi:hypothetical protein
VLWSVQRDGLSPVGQLLAVILRHRHGALLLFAAVLLVRAVMPAGYMIGSRDGVPTIELCSGMVGAVPHDMAVGRTLKPQSHFNVSSSARNNHRTFVLLPISTNPNFPRYGLYQNIAYRGQFDNRSVSHLRSMSQFKVNRNRLTLLTIQSHV